MKGWGRGLGRNCRDRGDKGQENMKGQVRGLGRNCRDHGDEGQRKIEVNEANDRR